MERHYTHHPTLLFTNSILFDSMMIYYGFKKTYNGSYVKGRSTIAVDFNRGYSYVKLFSNNVTIESHIYVMSNALKTIVRALLSVDYPVK